MNLNSEFWLKEAQKVAKIGFYVYDIKNGVWTSSEVLDELFGITDDYVRNFQGWLNIVHYSQRSELENYVMDVFTSGKDFNREYQVVRQNDKSCIWVLGKGKLYFDENGIPEKLIGTIHDISDFKKSEERCKNLYVEFQKKQSLLVSLINSIPDLIFYKNSKGEYLGCNKAFETFAGMKELDLIGLNDFDIFDKEVATSFREMDLEMMRQGKSRQNEEKVQYPNGNNVLLDTLKTPYYDPQGNILGLIGISRDITERKKREEEIFYLSYHDVLTGLYNRRFFEEEINRIDTQKNYPISIIIGDVNGLKLINDAFGHLDGDELLKKAAEKIKVVCSKKGIVARWGGDEFVVLLANTSNEAAEKICKEILNENKKIKISVSLGYATKIKSEETIIKTLKDAENMMYKNKLMESTSYRYLIIDSITKTLYEKDQETEEHMKQLKFFSKKLGSIMGFSELEPNELEISALLHNVNKLGISDNILNKQEKLNDEEY
jgi:diguanylate cyclase (GGDEF)-like protein/PAS domain S-box-containing protein